MNEVEQVNRKLLHHLDFAAVADRVPAGIGAAEWAILAGNVDHLAELEEWLPVLDGEIAAPDLSDEDQEFVALAAWVAENIDWSADPWAGLIWGLKEKTGRKGKALFLPLRLALTGRESGPEMAPMTKRIGKDRTVERLRAAS